MEVVINNLFKIIKARVKTGENDEYQFDQASAIFRMFRIQINVPKYKTEKMNSFWEVFNGCAEMSFADKSQNILSKQQKCSKHTALKTSSRSLETNPANLKAFCKVLDKKKNFVRHSN